MYGRNNPGEKNENEVSRAKTYCDQERQQKSPSSFEQNWQND